MAQGANHTLQYYFATPGNPWDHAQVAGAGTTYSAPSIFVRSNGEADIVAEGANDTLQYYFATPGNPWDHVQVAGAGTTYSAPSIFVRSADPQARPTSWRKEPTTPCSTTSPRPVTPSFTFRSPGPGPPTTADRWPAGI